MDSDSTHMVSGEDVEKRNGEENTAVQIVWDYLHTAHNITPFHTKSATVLLCLGSSDIRVARHASTMFLLGVAEWLCFSGGIGTGPHSGKNLLGWDDPEATVFAKEAIKLGVDPNKILIEAASRNTGENILLSYQLLTEKSIQVTSLVIATKPYMERRAYATFMKQWPQTTKPTMAVTSPDIECKTYLSDTGVKRADIIGIMVGDLQRIKLYAQPPQDFQIYQDIPPQVWAAFELLVSCGYTNNLVST
eukprot:m.100156 g.100156  ORF g.100156 m.100156 type:complete len:248 (-) comp27224_c0_seq1:154-897(-)